LGPDTILLSAGSFQQRGERGTGKLGLREESARTAARDGASEVVGIVAGCEHHGGRVIVAREAQGDLEAVDVWEP